jgi:subtilisin family serine protease
MRRAAVLLAALAACSDALVGPPSPASDPRAATVREPSSVVPDRFIVVLRDDVPDVDVVARRLAAEHGATLAHTYRAVLKGFAAVVTEREAARMARHPEVAYVEPDQVVLAAGTQAPATWGLDRIDQRPRSVPPENLYHYSATGAGVTAYVIDSGVRAAHNEFEGRATVGFDAFGGDGQDCWGHGTHVAGILGGKTFGVAKKVKIISVKVLNCVGSGTVSDAVAGINWVTGHHTAGQPAVANMSLGGGANAALDQAVQQSISDGITYSIAAGNGNIFGSGVDACNTSPARVPAAITTGATDNTDKKTTWSNYGTCVDVFAPGNNIPSAWGSTADPNAWQVASGTSMAAPAVGGVAALFLELVPGASPGQVSQAITGMATENVVTSSNTTGAKLLFAPWQDTDVNAAKVKLNSTPPPSPPPPPPPSCFLICLS